MVEWTPGKAEASLNGHQSRKLSVFPKTREYSEVSGDRTPAAVTHSIKQTADTTATRLAEGDGQPNTEAPSSSDQMKTIQ